MGGALDDLASRGRILLLGAAPREAASVAIARAADPERVGFPWTLIPLDERFDLALTGVGKANAASCLTHLFDPDRHAGAMSVGVAGALPGGPCAVGDLVLADRSVYADEGAATPSGFLSLAAMGFPPGAENADPPRPEEAMGVGADPGLLGALRPLADHVGGVATVSTCSGTDALARQIRDRTGAIAEAMEGAGVGFGAHRLGATIGRAIPFAEARAISNRTGDRERQGWDLPAALARLERFIAAL